MEGSATSRISSVYGLVALFSFFLSISYMTICLGARVDLHGEADMEFVNTSCAVTLYPDLCFRSLSVYATTVHMSPRKLAQVALSVSLKRARSASAMVVRLSKESDMSHRETEAVEDCVETIGDSIDELKQSLREMKHLEGPDFNLKLSNIQTWVSAALTNEDTCVDGFEGEAMNGNIKNIIKKYVVTLGHLISNALALINKLQ